MLVKKLSFTSGNSLTAVGSGTDIEVQPETQWSHCWWQNAQLWGLIDGVTSLLFFSAG